MSALIQRLTNQLRSKGVSEAKSKAIAILTKRGHYNGGHLTKEGLAREKLGNAGRAKDRAAKATKANDKPSNFKYNSKTNKAKRK